MNKIAIQNDGKIAICWWFTTYNWVASRYLVRLNSNWSKDTWFNIWTRFGGFVNALAVQSDGKVIAGGSFTSYSWSTTNRIIRINNDWSKDTSFNIWSWFNSTESVGVLALAVQSDGKIIVGGDFTNYNWTSINKLVRLNTDWSQDTSLPWGGSRDHPSEFASRVESI